MCGQCCVRPCTFPAIRLLRSLASCCFALFVSVCCTAPVLFNYISLGAPCIGIGVRSVNDGCGERYSYQPDTARCQMSAVPLYQDTRYHVNTRTHRYRCCLYFSVLCALLVYSRSPSLERGEHMPLPLAK